MKLGGHLAPCMSPRPPPPILIQDIVLELNMLIQQARVVWVVLKAFINAIYTVSVFSNHSVISKDL